MITLIKFSSHKILETCQKNRESSERWGTERDGTVQSGRGRRCGRGMRRGRSVRGARSVIQKDVRQSEGSSIKTPIFTQSVQTGYKLI